MSHYPHLLEAHCKFVSFKMIWGLQSGIGRSTMMTSHNFPWLYRYSTIVIVRLRVPGSQRHLLILSPFPISIESVSNTVSSVSLAFLA